ncbi:MAG: Multidrug resistance protein MdtA [Fimbriimonadaceae bacterium]|nr:Multidrug resistance protein MdtA [Fimbriimonadaceae bacterium]
MSVMTAGSGRNWRPLLVLAGFLVIVGGSALLLSKRQPSVASKPKEQTLTVPEGEAGKVGDLVVTQEAIKLAEITIKPVASQLVAEKIEVSGVVQAGGDQLVKVTPPVAGKVVRLLAGQGDSVKAGQTLAVLESSDLAAAQAAYRQASARLAAARVHLARQRELAKLGQFGKPQVEEARTRAVEADRDVHEADHHLAEEQTKLAEAESERQGLVSLLGQARAELEVAKARLDRAEIAYKEELIAKQEYERIVADHKKAVADVEVAVSKLGQGDARIKGARARVEAAEGELELAQRRAKIVGESLNREEKVYSGRFLTNREVVEAESAVRLAQVEANGAVDAVRLLGGTPGSGNTLRMVSPISGKVQERTATLGETIDSEHAAFTVVNLDRVWAQLAISPDNLPAIRVGDRVTLASEAAPGRTFGGVILSIGTAADETTRSVSVRTALDNPNDLLRPGSFVTGEVVTDVRRERVTVPSGAVQDHTGRPTVYVSAGKPGAFEVRHVKLGIKGENWQEITDGLKPGEQIAASGTFYLKSEALKDSLSDGCCAPGG